MKEQEKLNDSPCAHDAHETVCNTHHQPLVDCANQRLRYVKTAREMDERSMASARAWEKTANQKINERDRYKAVVDAARDYAANFCMTGCGMHETSDTFNGLKIKIRMAEALKALDQPAPAHEIVER